MTNNQLKNKKYYLVSTNNIVGNIVTIDELSNDRLLDIAELDLYTMQFIDKSDFLYHLYSSKSIMNKEEKIFIGRNKKESISCYDLLFVSDSYRMDVMKSIAQKRLNNEKITNSDVNDFLNRFITKLNNNRIFNEFMKLVLSDIDFYLYSKLNRGANKIEFNVKYKLEDKFTSYHTIRNIIYAWNLYGKLYSKYKDMLSNEFEISKRMREEYLEHYRFNYPSATIQKELNNKSKNIDGQTTIFDYQNEFEKSELVEQLDYDLQSEKIKTSPFNNEILRRLYNEGGLEKVMHNLSEKIIRSLSLEDQHRIGMIGFLEYKKLSSEREIENAKRNR